MGDERMMMIQERLNISCTVNLADARWLVQQLTAAQATIAQRDAQVAALEAELADIRMKHDHLAAIVDAQDQEDAIASMTPGTSTYYGEYTPTLTEQLAARDAQVAEALAALEAECDDDCDASHSLAPCSCWDARIDQARHALLARTPAAPVKQP